CWAAGCPSKGMNAGKIIMHLNETHDPYPKLIWPESEVDGFDVEDVEDVEEDDVENDDPFLPPLKHIDVSKLVAKTKPVAPTDIPTDDGSPPTPIAPVSTVEEILATVDKVGKNDQMSTYE